MTVQELIYELTQMCQGRDMSTVEIKKVVVVQQSDFWGSEDWEDPRLDAAGGVEYPFVVLIK